MNLAIKQTNIFEGTQCDILENDKNEVFMTAEQIGNALGYATPRESINKLVSRNEDLREIEFSAEVKMTSTDGKAYNTRVFTEDGIYEVTMLSKTKKAKEFRRWIRGILKSLRKGDMKLVQNLDSYQINDPIKRAEVWIKEEQERQFLIDKVSDYEPKVKYLKQITGAEDTMTITQIAKDYALTARKLNKILYEEKVQYKVGKQWVLFADYHDKGYTKSETIHIPLEDGTDKVRVNTKWTQAGREFIDQILKNREAKLA
ncbi:phage antirepressor KilAC domain-containing protein [Bacillus spongiae]|uniref:Phage antirepressor KilAC domain-containing protein n=1 Tax=Bacillus spongiae TaxID=2683610 RepID=A0ABU8HJG7_9BACI